MINDAHIADVALRSHVPCPKEIIVSAVHYVVSTPAYVFLKLAIESEFVVAEQHSSIA